MRDLIENPSKYRADSGQICKKLKPKDQCVNGHGKPENATEKETSNSGAPPSPLPTELTDERKGHACGKKNEENRGVMIEPRREKNRGSGRRERR